MTRHAISIVIPNFNGAHLLRRNLPSVMRATATYPGSVTLIVVDDGSTDDSVKVMQDEFPLLTLLQHTQNQGFSEACLTGVKAATTELVMLLNSDVELHSACLEKLEAAFSEPNIFSVCPLMLEEDGSINRHSWNLRAFRRGYLKLDDWSHEAAIRLRACHPLPTLYSSGGSMLVSREKFLALGGFHPLYKPFYGEDFDLGMRAWYRGWPSYFEPEATLVHQSKGSIKDNFKRSRVKQVRRRNRYFLEWTHTPLPKLLCSTLPFSLLQLLGELVTFDRTNLRGFLTAIQQLPAVLRVRQETLSGQVIGLDAVLQKLQAAKHGDCAITDAGNAPGST